MLLPLFVVPITTLLCICFSRIYFNTKLYDSRLFKLMTLISFYFNLFYSIWLWKTFPRISIDGLDIIFPSGIRTANGFLFEVQPGLGLPFIMLSSSIILIGLLTAWYSSVNTNVLTSLLLLTEFCLIGAFSCTSLFVFLLFFELSALPIFILISYAGSPRRERIKASYYFIVFTLYGSLALLLVILNLYGAYQSNYAEAGDQQSIIFLVLLFVAFSVKIPLFPFHIWLPYAHVEASTTASIILAALLLKLGGYGILKFILPVFDQNIQIYFQPVAWIICIIGLIYGGFCSIRQIDMKRQIAFSSISHMSFALLGVFTYTEIGIKGGMYLMISHGLTSAALFFLIGVLSDRYHTRSVFAYGGAMTTMPVFVFFLIVFTLANVGFPGTSGFVPELFTVVAVMSSSTFILLPVLFGMFLTAAGGLLLLARIAYGHVKQYSNFGFSDLNRSETFILSVLAALVFWFGLNDPWLGTGVGLIGLPLLQKRSAYRSSTSLFAVIALAGLGQTINFILSFGPEMLMLAFIFVSILRIKSSREVTDVLGVQWIKAIIYSLCLYLLILFLTKTDIDLNISFLLIALFAIVTASWFYNQNSWLSPVIYCIIPFMFALLVWYEFIYVNNSFGLNPWFSTYIISVSSQSEKLIIAALLLALAVIINATSKPDGISEILIYWLIFFFAVSLFSIDNLVLIFIALEGFSLALYILPTLRGEIGGVSASAKYFAFGTLGSICILWGVAILFIQFQTFNLSELYPLVIGTSSGVGAIFIGLLIKIGAAPLHFWVPDVYTGAPLRITLIFSTLVKVVLLFVFWRISYFFNPGGEVELAAIASIIVGCYYALKQKEVKRFLAYSSIVHTGFLLLVDAASSILYLIIYVVATLLFFSVLQEWNAINRPGKDIFFMSDLRSINIRDYPLHSIFLIVSLMTMAGLPPFGGFYIKFLVFAGLVEDITNFNDVTSIIMFGIVAITSILTMFYYLRAVNYMLVGSLNYRRLWYLIESGKSIRILQIWCTILLVAAIVFVPAVLTAVITLI